MQHEYYTNKEKMNFGIKSRFLSAEELIEQRGASLQKILPSAGMKHENYEKESLDELYNKRMPLLCEERVESLHALSEAEYNYSTRKILLTKYVGRFWLKMGYVENNNKYLRPEEALFLLESVQIQIFYNQVPLSVQEAYALFLDDNDCSLEKYQVYAHLMRLGYIVVRHQNNASNDGTTNKEIGVCMKRHSEELDDFVTNCSDEEVDTISNTNDQVITNKQESEILEKPQHKKSKLDGNLVPEINLLPDFKNNDMDSVATTSCPDLKLEFPNSIGSKIVHLPIPPAELLPPNVWVSNTTCLLNLNQNNISIKTKKKSRCFKLHERKKRQKQSNESNPKCAKYDFQSEYISEANNFLPEKQGSRAWFSDLTSTFASTPILENLSNNNVFHDQLHILELNTLENSSNKNVIFSDQSDKVELSTLTDDTVIPADLNNSAEYSKLSRNSLIANKTEFLSSISKQNSDDSRTRYRKCHQFHNWKECKREITPKERKEQLVAGQLGHLWNCEETPLLKPHQSINTESILARLQCINNSSSSKISQLNNSDRDKTLKIFFDVHLPDCKFKKSLPSKPDHRIVVLRASDNVPDLFTITSLQGQLKDNSPIHFAVNDNGSVGFYVFSETMLPVLSI